MLGTPRLIALVEEAALGAVADQLPKGQTTVGMRVQIDHLAPTNVGSSVAAEATLEKVEGRRLTFTVSVTDHVRAGGGRQGHPGDRRDRALPREGSLAGPSCTPRGGRGRPLSAFHHSSGFSNCGE